MIRLTPGKDMFGDDVPLWEKGQEGGRTRPIDRLKCFENACAVSEVFNKLGIKHCLSHGTILGVLRKGDIIPWDDDVDIAMFSEDRPKLEEARNELRNLGFFVPAEGDPEKPVEPFGPVPNMPYYDFVAIRNGEKVEGWIFDLKEDYYVYDEQRDGLAIPRKLFDTLSFIKWRDRTFPAPSNPIRFVELMYGPTWRRPDKNKKYNNLRPGGKIVP
jgi:hypothetical protein